MKASIEYVKRKFGEFNRRMFAGRLPEIPMELSDAATFMGMCVFKVRHLSDGRKEYSDFRLRINIRVDLPETVLEDIIIHEMIHYFIHYNGFEDSSAHGHIFRALMQEINTRHGRHITVTHRSTPEQREQSVSTRRTWHIIAVVRFRNGRKGVKVLPRVASKVIEYCRQVKASSDVADIELFLHDNPFFNRYPVSAALRVYNIEADDLAKNIAGARRIAIRGTGLVEIVN